MNRKNGSAESLTLMYLAKSLDRQAEMEKLIERLWTRLEKEHVLLNSALHELAAANSKPGQSAQHFIAGWYRKRGGRL